MVVKEYLEKAEKYLDELYEWGKTLSERTLSLAAIVILYLTFLPDLVAYLNNITDQLPSLNSYIIVTTALVIMFARSIFKDDKVQSIIHLAGLTSQIITAAFILMK